MNLRVKKHRSSNLHGDLDRTFRGIELNSGGEKHDGLFADTFPVGGIILFSDLVVSEPDSGVLLGDTSESLGKHVTTDTSELGELGEEVISEHLEFSKLTSLEFFNIFNLDNLESINNGRLVSLVRGVEKA